MPKRIQSPSSINLYKQCPRRYFYSYILKYPTAENIHCVRGTIVHTALERFFDLEPEKIDPIKYKQHLALHLKKRFTDAWSKARKRLLKVGLNQDELQLYHDDSVQQLANWLNHQFKLIDKKIKTSDFLTAWNSIKPHSREVLYKDLDLSIRGYVDAIHKEGEHVTVIDYKTSKKFDITPEYKLQLGIYALMYERKHGIAPQKAGIWFLKDRLKTIDIDEELIKNAKFEIEQIHFATESDQISDYPKKQGPLCKYSTGQCDFFDVCKPFANRY